MKYLGQRGEYQYYSHTDGYVYQFKGTISHGWLCTYATWVRTFRGILL